jgi:hypothetical protein
MVTTSSFSKQAVEFSRGKNLELIDGPALSLLIETLTISNDLSEPILTEAQIGFQLHPQFDRDHYLMLDTKIKRNPKIETPQKVLIDYLFSSIPKVGKDAISNGLVDECYARLDLYLEAFYRGKKEEHKHMRFSQTYNKAVLLFIKGQFGAAYELFMNNEKGFSSLHAESLKYLIALSLGFPSVAQEHIKKISGFTNHYYDDQIKRKVDYVLSLHQEMNVENLGKVLITWPINSISFTLKELQELFDIDFTSNFEDQRNVFKIYGEV